MGSVTTLHRGHVLPALWRRPFATSLPWNCAFGAAAASGFSAAARGAFRRAALSASCRPIQSAFCRPAQSALWPVPGSVANPRSIRRLCTRGCGIRWPVGAGGSPRRYLAGLFRTFGQGWRPRLTKRRQLLPNGDEPDCNGERSKEGERCKPQSPAHQALALDCRSALDLVPCADIAILPGRTAAEFPLQVLVLQLRPPSARIGCRLVAHFACSPFRSGRPAAPASNSDRLVSRR